MQQVRQHRVATPTETETTTIVQHEERFMPAPTQFVPRPGPRHPSILADIPQAPHAVATRQPNALKRLAVGTVCRAGLLAGGMYLVGIRGAKPLILGSLASSATLSFLLTVHHAYVQRRGW